MKMSFSGFAVWEYYTVLHNWVYTCLVNVWSLLIQLLTLQVKKFGLYRDLLTEVDSLWWTPCELQQFLFPALSWPHLFSSADVSRWFKTLDLICLLHVWLLFQNTKYRCYLSGEDATFTGPYTVYVCVVFRVQTLAYRGKSAGSCFPDLRGEIRYQNPPNLQTVFDS